MSLKAYLSTHRKPAQSLTTVVFGEKLTKFRDLLNLTHNTLATTETEPYPMWILWAVLHVCYISFSTLKRVRISRIKNDLYLNILESDTFLTKTFLKLRLICSSIF